MYPLQMVLDSSIRMHPEIGALATSDNKSAWIMVWNYHDEDKQGAAEKIRLNISKVPGNSVTVAEYRIDAIHSNSYEAWKKMGSPQKPTEAQVRELEKAGQLETVGKAAKVPANEEV